MILHESYRDDAFEALEAVPRILDRQRTANGPVAPEMDAFVEGLWARYQKNVEEYGLDAGEAVYDALGDTLKALSANAFGKK